MKSAFVMLAGRSNVGKSTLLNALVGTKVAIVTPKPQTTRHPVRGILHDPRGQIVFVDTPGVFLGRKDFISKRLNEFVKETLEGVDAIVYVMDPTRAPGLEEEMVQTLLRATRIPIVAVINKSDLHRKDRPFAKAFADVDVGQVATLELSALKMKDLNRLIDVLFSIVPEGEAHYPDQQLTDIRHKDWVEELIREKVFLALEQELPYSTKVVVEDIEEREDGSRFIQANIWTTDERYKRMIIGAHGAKIKDIGTKARKELETALQAKIFLEMNVKVDPRWQERFH
ncbi:GTPase Era [Candidatus Uhrbacteria bacterium]|nr:GTPase Era [Candidatus Uhrbacteria bacterium]